MAKVSAQKSVLILCGDYAEDYEVMVPFQALQAFGVAVDAVCPGKSSGEICRTAVQQLVPQYKTNIELRGHNFTLNATFDEINAKDYDGLLISGGRSPEYLAMDEKVLSLVLAFEEAKKPIAAVCHAPLILAAAGMLGGRKCTAYPGVMPVLVAAGAHWVDPGRGLTGSVVDGNLITAATYRGHPGFIRSFVEALGGAISGADNKRILFLCGDFMEDYEIKVPFQALEVLGCQVDAVCPQKNKDETCPTAILEFEGDQTYSAKTGHNFTLNKCFESVEASCYDGLVIPGGRAPEYLALDENVINLVKQFMGAGKPVASIGYGPQVLSAAEVLKGRQCTAYPTVKLNLVLAGATWLEPQPIYRCFTDKNLVTGAAWHGHPEFISQFMSVLGIKVLF